MRGRKPKPFVLKAKDAATLHGLLRDGKTPLKVARRAQILLDRADEQQRVVLLSDQVQQGEATVWRICARYRQGGLPAALYDAPRSGRPRVFPHAERQAIEDLACQAPASVGWEVTYGSQRRLAQAAGELACVDVASIDQTTVRDILLEADLQLHRFRYWKTAVWDDEAVERALKILWYDERIDRLWQRGEVLICVDEKPNIQVLERARPSQRMRPGQMERQEFESLLPPPWHGEPAGWLDGSQWAHVERVSGQERWGTLPPGPAPPAPAVRLGQTDSLGHRQRG